MFNPAAYPARRNYHQMRNYQPVEEEEEEEYDEEEAEDGMAIDPAILAESGEQEVLEPDLLTPSRSPSPDLENTLQYDRPQSPPPAFSEAEGEQSSITAPSRPVRPLKRPRRPKRPPTREEECGVCQGNDESNKDRVPELMASCSQCGRSIHPTCNKDLSKMGHVIRNYDWKCFKCKDCEVCGKKGDANRLLICDSCDRGWHLYCLDPPLETAPDEDWVCPTCEEDPPPPPPVASGSQSRQESHDAEEAEADDVARVGPRVELGSLLSDQESSEEDDDYDESYAPDGDVAMDDEPAPGRSAARSKGKGRANGRSRSRARRKRLTLARPRTSARPSPLAVAKGKGKVPPRTPRTPPTPAPPPRRQPRVSVKPLHTPPPPPDPHPPTRNVIKLSTKVITKELLKQQVAYERSQFGDLLDEKQANCEGTRIEAVDKRRWENAKKKAEERLGVGAALPPPNGLSAARGATPATFTGGTPAAGPSTPFGLGISTPQFNLKLPPTRSTRLQMLQMEESSTPVPAPTPAANGPQRVRTIRFGVFDIDTWYDAPFPEEYAHVPDGRMWICEFCLKYMKSGFGNMRHRMKCKARHPPGDEIYRAGSVSVFEVDGRKNKIYCQNLCLLAKMFLDHKTLFYDVEPFLFYVMTEIDDGGARFVGYFSKEKRCSQGNNVSCIMTLPARQRRGWGNLLIGFSYLLSKKEGRVGSPERPLSGLGKVAYHNYWELTLMQFLLRTSPTARVRLEDISAATAMTLSDIVATLQRLHMIAVHDTLSHSSPSVAFRGQKRGRGGFGRQAARRDSGGKDDEPVVVIPKSYTIQWDPERVAQFCADWEKKGYLTLQPEKLQWSPFIISRTQKTDVEGLEGLGAQNLGGQPLPLVNGTSQEGDANVTPPGVPVPQENGVIEHPPPDTVEDAERALTALIDKTVSERPTARLTRGRSRKSVRDVNGVEATPERRRTRSQINLLGVQTNPSTLPLRRKRSAPDASPSESPSIEPSIRPSPSKKRRIVLSEESSPPPDQANTTPTRPKPLRSTRTRSFGIVEVVVPPLPRKSVSPRKGASQPAAPANPASTDSAVPSVNGLPNGKDFALKPSINGHGNDADIPGARIEPSVQYASATHSPRTDTQSVISPDGKVPSEAAPPMDIDGIDEDAEGEPDADGEFDEDIDAEGEPDPDVT